VALARLFLSFFGERRAGLGKGFVWGCGRPADHDQKHIEDEERDGNVVEECRLAEVRPELIGSPKEKGNCQQDCLDDFKARRPMRGLVDEIGEGDHGQRKCGQKVMRPGRKELGKSVPYEQHRNASQRDCAENHRESAMRPVKTNIHRPF